MEGDGDRVIALHTLPNLIVMDGPRYEAYLREEGLDAAIEWRKQHDETSQPGRERYRKYAKALVGGAAADGAFGSRMGLEIEFLLEANPAQLRPGERLPVQLLWRGKPAAGLPVDSAWTRGGASKIRVIGRTGADGRITVPLDEAGVYRLHAVAVERCAEEATADWDTYWASLTFELREVR